MRDMTGRKIGRLTFVQFGERDVHGKPMWRVRCDCGVEFLVRVEAVKSGNTLSCGCIRRERMINYNKLKRK